MFCMKFSSFTVFKQKLILFYTCSIRGLAIGARNHSRSYRVPLGLKPMPVVLTNKTVGTHVLTIHRHTLTTSEGYSLTLQKLNPWIIAKQGFNIRYNAMGGIVFEFGNGLDALSSYTRDGLLYVGEQEEIHGTLPMYLRKEMDASDRDDIVLFRVIAGEKCLGLSTPLVDTEDNTFFVPSFRKCERGAEDQLWAVFLLKEVQGILEYDRHLINRHTFNDQKEYYQAHEWPTLKFLLDKLHEMGRLHLSTWH